jgi:hypothetical protein
MTMPPTTTTDPVVSATGRRRNNGPLPGLPASVPPPDIPLSFLAAAGVGLVGAGIALALVARHLVAVPTADQPIATVHLVMLAFLTTGVLGAVHQFACVTGRRPLRSTWLARTSVVLTVAGSWALAAGFATGANHVVAIAGATLGIAVLAVGWNVTSPLFGPGGGVPIIGLRFSIAGLLTTAFFGITYAFDRQGDERWFRLDPNIVLAHAHIGLLAWLGLTYVAVAEKLWPMFLLAHRPGRSPGAIAVWAIPAGVVLLSAGLLSSIKYLAVAGGLVVAGGITAHLVSFASLLRHRRRPPELLHAFIAASSLFVIGAVALAAVSGLGAVTPAVRSRLVSAEVASLAAWVGLALIGHAHKVVPFISWGILRRHGVSTTADGRPLLFADLWNRRVGWVTFAAATVGSTAVVAGLATGTPGSVTAGGILLATSGLLAIANLSLGPRLASRAGGRTNPASSLISTSNLISKGATT